MGFEGYRPMAAQLADGRWTIGYGHVKTARAGVSISESDARILLLYDMTEINLALQDLIFTPLNQNQVDALASFTFNVSVPSFEQSAVLKRINEGALLQAACELDLWRRADLHGEGLVVDALVRRRAAEKALFLTPTAGWTPVPTPVVRPTLDRDLSGVVPASEPIQVRTSLYGDLATAEVVRSAMAPAAEAPLAEDGDAEAPAIGSRLEDAGDAVSERLQMIMAGMDEPHAEPLADVEAPTAVDEPAIDHSETEEPDLFGPLRFEAASAEAEPEPAALEAEPATPKSEVVAEAEANTHAVDDEDEQTDASPFKPFRPIPVSPAVFLDPTSAPALGPVPAAESFRPEPIAPLHAVLSRPAPAMAEPAIAEPETQPAPAWVAESTAPRPTLFPTLDGEIEPRGAFRTPGSARFATYQLSDLERRQRRLTPYLIVGLVGLLLFVCSVAWALAGHPAGPINPLLVFAAALAGIVCVVLSVYQLVHRFLGREL